VSARSFTSPERHTRQPNDQQNCGHYPKKMAVNPIPAKISTSRRTSKITMDVIFL
jgi:hypothetical protein